MIEGDIIGLKDSIKGQYQKKHDEIEKYNKQKTKEIKSEYQKIIESVEKENEALLEEELSVYRNNLLNQLKNEIEFKFAQEQKQIIEEQFTKISLKIKQSKEYTNLIKRLVGNIKFDEIMSDNKRLLSMFNSKSKKINKTVNGITLRSKEIFYDFRIDQMLEDKKNELMSL